MCGIVGVLDTKKVTTEAMLSEMAKTLTHRGPDDAGSWQDESGLCTYGFQRLAFFDLTPAGHQPMSYRNFTLVLNGEIYNYQSIKDELNQKGHTFVGTSDTEVLLHAWAEWGSEAVHKFRGMFAFAIFDTNKKELYIYRDRLGVKPLYYFEHDGLFAFASELKALLVHPLIQKHKTLDNEALSLFFQLSYIPAPWSIFKHIKKLDAAHSLTISATGTVTKQRYWDVNDYYQTENTQTEAEIITELESRFKEAFALRMLADRPVGMFLSGGVDSSLVAGVLSRQFDNLQTFTIGFAESDHNEAPYAEEVAAYLKTKQHTKYCTPAESQAVLPKLSQIYDEPFADASAIPTYLVSQFAHEKVVASLSADGGDELFGGYNSYQSMNSLITLLNRFSYLGGQTTIRTLVFLLRIAVAAQVLPQRFLHKAEKVADLYPLRHNIPALFARFHSHYSDAEVKNLLVQNKVVPAADVFTAKAPTKDIGALRTLQHIDLHLYMPDDILVKVDRSTMACSLEGREPLLDHTVVEYIASLPYEKLQNHQTSKGLLKKVLYNYVPQHLVDRPKQGFGVPLDRWLKGDLRHLLDTYLDETKIVEAGILDSAMVAKEKADFLSGKRPYTRVWNIIVFQMWYDLYLK
jgi:asparagine synthase (glutamine-hydrolysing)